MMSRLSEKKSQWKSVVFSEKLQYGKMLTYAYVNNELMAVRVRRGPFSATSTSCILPPKYLGKETYTIRKEIKFATL